MGRRGRVVVALAVVASACAGDATGDERDSGVGPGAPAEAGVLDGAAFDAALAIDGSRAIGSADAGGTRDGAAGGGDASTADGGAADADAGAAFTIGVNVHNYPKPTAYGYLAADGADRMGDGLTYLGVRYVRGPTIGDVAFLTRLAGFGVTHVILGLDAKAYGKPFDATKLETALAASLAEARRLNLHVVVEGLNEWDLFNTRAYNDGVEPAGVDTSEFVALTQQALYEAAHPEGVPVLGPSVGHGQDPANLAFFPDVAAYVDIVHTRQRRVPFRSVRLRRHQEGRRGRGEGSDRRALSPGAGVLNCDLQDLNPETMSAVHPESRGGRRLWYAQPATVPIPMDLAVEQ